MATLTPKIVNSVLGEAFDQSPTQSPCVPWPAPLKPEAITGLAWEIVQTLEPHTESDPAALLLQLLAGFGSCIGPAAHYIVERSHHYPRLFIAIVGESSKARKGTAWDNIRSLLTLVDPSWKHRIASGLSSGEGLIWAVRDPITKKDKDGGEILVDGGVTDKRLLAVETELASPLKAGKRDSNTLSAILRDAWDKTDLQTLTKNSPARATGAHISLIGHITLPELRGTLGTTDCLNGFGNRFLWTCARRSKLLPDGGSLAQSDFDALVKRLALRLDNARNVREMRRSNSAKELWHSVYPTLTRNKPGLFGALTSRAEAQVLRLSLIFALLDGTDTIGEFHLRSALEVWRYCEDSAQFIFGDRMDDEVAEGLRKALAESGQAGLTRKELGEHFSGHISKSKLDTALASLKELGLAHATMEATGGRPAERWFDGAGKAS